VRVRDLSPLELYQLLLTTRKSKAFREENRSYNSLVDSYTHLVGGRSYNATQWFFTNVCKGLKTGHKAFSVRLKADYWSGNICGIGIRQVKAVLDWFEYNEYITVYLGNKDYRCEWKTYPTIVKINQKLIDLIDMEAVSLHIPDDGVVSPIVVKDRETKEPIAFEISDAVKEMEEEMNIYNESVKNVSVEFNGEEVPRLEYKRSFSGDLFKGGRLFAHGGSIQLIPEKFRLQYLTLDKEPVCEIDYKANHANILYESVAQGNDAVYKLAKKDFDPYKADSSFMQLDEKLIAKHMIKHNLTKYDPVRNLFKKSLMMAINCASEAKARQSINHELHKDSLLDEVDRQYVGLVNPHAPSILEALSEHNELIDGYFYKDYGIVLQNIDSRIALRVIDYLIQEGHTCLAYHDSFAVKRSIKPLLEYAMHAAWKDILGANAFCYTEEK